MLFVEEVKDISTTTTTMAFNTKSIYFPEDIFKQIVAYAQPLPKCDAKKCLCVATDECLNCKDVCCKAHIATDIAVQGLCVSCVKRGYVFCDLCPGEYTTMECENCAQMFCFDCCARDNEDGLIYDGLCCECSPEGSDAE